MKLNPGSAEMDEFSPSQFNLYLNEHILSIVVGPKNRIYTESLINEQKAHQQNFTHPPRGLK